MRKVIHKQSWYDELVITTDELKRLRFYKISKATDEAILKIFPEMNQRLLDWMSVEEIDRLMDKYPHADIFFPYVKKTKAVLHE